MKKAKRFLSLVLTLIMLFTLSSTAFAGFDEISKAVWDTAWEKSGDSIKAAVTMFPGSDENDRTIAWYSDAKEGYVELKTLTKTEKFDATAKETPQGEYRLSVALTNLDKGIYSYKCVSGDFTSKTYTFTVEDSKSFTALYVSDIHISESEENENEVRDTAYQWDTTIEAAAAQAILEGNTLDLILSGGDQASEGLLMEYKGLSAPGFIKSLPFANAIGNHDRKSVNYKYYTAYTNEPDQTFKSYIGADYWFRQGDALFLMLDSCNVSMKEHYKFMKNATQANSDAKWIIAVLHHDMFGGREPWLDTENTMLRLLWTPFFDEFGVDMCLYGHSHYYSVSNVIYNRKTVEKTGHNAELTDPQGTVYLASGSISRHAPLLDDEGNVPPVGENAGYTWLEDETVYSLMDFSGDTLTVKSYTVESGEEFNRLTITKTSNQGGHQLKNPAWYLKPIAFFIGRIVNIINNIDMYQRYKDQGYDVSLKEGLIGS